MFVNSEHNFVTCKWIFLKKRGYLLHLSPFNLLMINNRDQDREILASIHQGGQARERVLRQLYMDNRSKIGHLVRANSGTEEEAKDVIQEAIIAFYENVKKGLFKGESNTSTYLYSIARFIWLNKLKRKNLETHKLETTHRTIHEPALPRRIIDRESRQQLLNFFSRLGKDCQQVLMDTIYYNRNMKEIAKNMGYENEQIARNKKYLCLKKTKRNDQSESGYSSNRKSFMMNEKQRQELIERYLNEMMTDEEITRFNEKLKTDPLLLEELQLEQAAHSIVIEAGREDLRASLEGFEEEWQNKQTKTKLVSLSSRRLLSLVAALLLLIMAMTWFYQNQIDSPQDLFATHFEAYRSPSPERGNTLTSNWQKASTAYAAANYIEAASLFQESIKDSTAIPYLSHFYLGISLLAQQPPRLESAIHSLEKVLLSDNDYQLQAKWYMALAFLKLDQKDKAKTWLEDLLKTGGFKEVEAAEVLKTLK